MTDVLVIAGEFPQQETVLVEALERFRGSGARVHLLCNFDVGRLSVDPGLAELHALPDPGAQDAPRFRKAVAREQQPSRRIWLRAWRDAWVRERARRADLLVALDALAVHTVWELAQRHRTAQARYGLGPALKVVAGGAVPPANQGLRDAVSASGGIALRGARRSAVDGVKRALHAAMSPPVMRSGVGERLWRTTVSAPGLPDRVRSGLAYRVHVRMVEAGRPASAARASRAAAAKLRDRRTRADLLMREAHEELSLGRTPACLPEAVSAELALADDFHARKNMRKASRSLYKAIRLIFDRVVHFDQLSSPLAEDAAAFLAPLRRSAAARALATPRGRATPAATPPSGRPLRLVIATNGNDNFLHEIRQRYADSPAVEVRFLDFQADPVSAPLAASPASIVEHRLAGQSEYGNRVEEWLRPHLEWADTIFVDWCVAAAAMVTLQDPGTTRVIVRLHSFEALSYWPHLVDFSRVDDLVFVSDHLRDLATAVLPQLTGEQAPRLHVVNNAMDLKPYPRDKDAAARFTLALVGVNAVAKDPRWAVEVLRLLRAEDPRYRLLLFGNGPDPGASAAIRQYQDLLSRDLAELEPSGAVVRLGHVHDVPQALTEVGVILSSSVRESFHCGLVEGAASGAVPAVRNWPFFAGKAHGAHTLFPADWVVDTPAEAAARIRALTATEEGWREAGRAASAHALATWDWTITQRSFDELFGVAVPEPTH